MSNDQAFAAAERAGAEHAHNSQSALVHYIEARRLFAAVASTEKDPKAAGQVRAKVAEFDQTIAKLRAEASGGGGGGGGGGGAAPLDFPAAPSTPLDLPDPPTGAMNGAPPSYDGKQQPMQVAQAVAAYPQQPGQPVQMQAGNAVGNLPQLRDTTSEGAAAPNFAERVAAAAAVQAAAEPAAVAARTRTWRRCICCFVGVLVMIVVIVHRKSTKSSGPDCCQPDDRWPGCTRTCAKGEVCTLEDDMCKYHIPACEQDPGTSCADTSEAGFWVGVGIACAIMAWGYKNRERFAEGDGLVQGSSSLVLPNCAARFYAHANRPGTPQGASPGTVIRTPIPSLTI